MTGDKTNPAPMSEDERLIADVTAAIEGAFHEGAAYPKPINAAHAINNAVWHAGRVMENLRPRLEALRSLPARDGVGDEALYGEAHELAHRIFSTVDCFASASCTGRSRHSERCINAGREIAATLSTSLAAERGARERAEGAALGKACEAWEHCVGDPPEWESPLMDVWQAALMWSTELLAKRLNVTNYVAIDGSDSIEGDHGGTMMQVLIAAGLIDADTHESVSADLRARLGVARAEALEEAALAVEDIAHARFREYGRTEVDTGTAYYLGPLGEFYEAQDDENEICATAIRALKDKDPS